jgi:hypothetical protein
VKFFLFVLLLFPISIFLKAGDITDVSDSSIKKNYFGIELSIGHTFFVPAWGYGGCGIYQSSSLQPDSHYNAIYENKDIFLFSLKILDFNENTSDDDMILAGGYFSRCQCGVLLRRDNANGQWQEMFFDDIDNPFVSNIFSIATNAGEVGNDFTRVFLGCANGVIYYSEDDAISLIKANINAGNNVIKNIAFVDNRNGYAIAGKELDNVNQLFVTTDSGGSWRLLKDFAGDYIAINNISVSGDTVLLFGSQLTKGIILISQDAGAAFEYIKFENSTKFPRSLISGGLIENRVLAVDEEGNIYASGSNIFECHKLANGSKTAKFTDACFRDGLILISGYKGKIFKYEE